MRAMVMAAGLGKRLRPLTYEIPKPMVPVGNRPIMEHVLKLLGRNDIGEVVANLHWFGETIRGRFGDGKGLGIELTYSEEAELLGTAGGVRNVREFFGDDPFCVMAADALTDIDLEALAATHAANDWIATLAVKRVAAVDEFGVVVTGSDGRVHGFQEKPDPAEALSDLANCMVYILDPEIFAHFPDSAEVDFANDVFPALLEQDVAFGVHLTDAYWNDVGSLPEYIQGNMDMLAGAVEAEPSGKIFDAEADGPGCLGEGVELEGRVLVGEGAKFGDGAQLHGPLIVGPGASIGARSRVRESVLLEGAEVGAGSLLAGAISGRVGV